MISSPKRLQRDANETKQRASFSAGRRSQSASIFVQTGHLAPASLQTTHWSVQKYENSYILSQKVRDSSMSTLKSTMKSTKTTTSYIAQGSRWSLAVFKMNENYTGYLCIRKSTILQAIYLSFIYKKNNICSCFLCLTFGSNSGIFARCRPFVQRCFLVNLSMRTKIDRA